MGLRQTYLMVNVINDIFRYYLIMFPPVLLSILAFLLFGSVRLWHVDPKCNLMFPLCAIRCGFEAICPLAMAGKVNKAGELVLAKWKETKCHMLWRNGKSDSYPWKRRKLVKLVQISCQRIHCSAGSLYSFENSIVICCMNNCFQLALNMLVSFG